MNASSSSSVLSFAMVAFPSSLWLRRVGAGPGFPGGYGGRCQASVVSLSSEAAVASTAGASSASAGTSASASLAWSAGASVTSSIERGFGTGAASASSAAAPAQCLIPGWPHPPRIEVLLLFCPLRLERTGEPGGLGDRGVEQIDGLAERLEELVQDSIRIGEGVLNDTGALVIRTGEFTGRSPKDKFTVKDETTADSVHWNDFNIPIEPKYFDIVYKKVMDYLDNLPEIWVRDCYACADPRYRLNIRVINEKPWNNLFAYNMFLRPRRRNWKIPTRLACDFCTRFKIRSQRMWHTPA